MAFKAAIGAVPDDPTGRNREGVAWSLLASGRVAEGYRAAIELAGIRGTSAAYNVLLARAAFVNDDREFAEARLREGIEKLGFNSITWLQNCPDFPKDNKAVRDLTALPGLSPHVLSTAITGAVSGMKILVINRSLFPLADVSVKVSYEWHPDIYESHPEIKRKNGATSGSTLRHEITGKFAIIGPDGRVSIPFDEQFPPAWSTTATVHLTTSDQGRATTTLRLRIEPGYDRGPAGSPPRRRLRQIKTAAAISAWVNSSDAFAGDTLKLQALVSERRWPTGSQPSDRPAERPRPAAFGSTRGEDGVTHSPIRTLLPLVRKR